MFSFCHLSTNNAFFFVLLLSIYYQNDKVLYLFNFQLPSFGYTEKLYRQKTYESFFYNFIGTVTLENSVTHFNLSIRFLNFCCTPFQFTKPPKYSNFSCDHSKAQDKHLKHLNLWFFNQQLVLWTTLFNFQSLNKKLRYSFDKNLKISVNKK